VRAARRPVVLVSGDDEICREVAGFRSQILTVPTKLGLGAATLNEHPLEVVDRLKETSRAALSTGTLSALGQQARNSMPSEWRLEVRYADQREAYRKSFYPSARLESPRLVCFEHQDYFEILRAVEFLT
jgi:D-amino peptidase